MALDCQGQVPELDAMADVALCGPTDFSCSTCIEFFSGVFGARGVTTGSNGLGMGVACAAAVVDKKCTARIPQSEVRSEYTSIYIV